MGHRRPKQTSILNQISRTNTGPNQTFPTNFGISPNISNRGWSWANILLLPPQLLLRRRGKSQPIQAPTKYLQQTSGISRSLSGYDHLAHHTRRFLLNPPNRCRGPMNCPHSPPRLPEILSTDTRDFEPGAVNPPEPSEILSPGGPPTGSSEALFIYMIKRIFIIFLWLCGLFTPFNAKLTIARCFYPFYAGTLINLKGLP